MSESFETTPPGFPGSPSHLSVTNHSVDSVVLCWRESAIGRPFTTYNVEITESLNTLRSKVLKLNISSVRHVEGCEAGAKVHIILYKYVYSAVNPLPTIFTSAFITLTTLYQPPDYRPGSWDLLYVCGVCD